MLRIASILYFLLSQVSSSCFVSSNLLTLLTWQQSYTFTSGQYSHPQATPETCYHLWSTLEPCCHLQTMLSSPAITKANALNIYIAVRPSYIPPSPAFISGLSYNSPINIFSSQSHTITFKPYYYFQTILFLPSHDINLELYYSPPAILSPQCQYILQLQCFLS